MTYINIYKHINTHDWSFVSEVDIPIYLSFATIKHIKFPASAILPFKQKKKNHRSVSSSQTTQDPLSSGSLPTNKFIVQFTLGDALLHTIS